MDDRETRITRLWTALNHQDVDAALAQLHPDVDWQDIMNGGRHQGVEAVRNYWAGVYALITSDSACIDCHPVDADRMAARMLHAIRDKKGTLWSEERMTHVFTFRDGLISRMDLADPA